MRITLSLILLCVVMLSGCSQPSTNAPQQSEKEDVEKATSPTSKPETTAQGDLAPGYTASEQASADAAKARAAAAGIEATHDAEASAIAREQAKETRASKREAACRIEEYADERNLTDKEANAFAVLIGAEAAEYKATLSDVLDLRGVPRYENQCKVGHVGQ